MDLLSKYKELNRDIRFLEYYSETGNGKYGKMYSYQNTNNRYLLSFITNYYTFKEGADGVDRHKWDIAGHGQEKLKQHTVNMIKTRFFSKNERVYYRTKKGKVLEKINDNFNENEKWVLLYLLILDSYFNNIPNYIVKKSEEILEELLVRENNKDNILYVIKDFLDNSKSYKIVDAIAHPYMYLDTFYKPYNDFDFLSMYLNSPMIEKVELHKYIHMNYSVNRDLLSKSKSNDRNISDDAKIKLCNYAYDCITKKYRNGGNFDLKMLIDNAKILFLSLNISGKDFMDFREFVNYVIDLYSSIEKIDKDKVLQFIFKDNKDIFEICYLNIFSPEYFDNINNIDIDISEEEDIIARVQTNSIIENIEDIKKVSSILKRKALERAEYKCELESLCNCSSHYFTNKKNNLNYVELHHFIPRQFSNEFESSIEQIENYVSLCPRCHRFIHFAVDRERKVILHYLYTKRKEALGFKGIEVTENQLKQFYKVEE